MSYDSMNARVILRRQSDGLSIEGTVVQFHLPVTTVSKLRQFRSSHICLYLSEETLKAGGPFYLVSMPGKVKVPTQGKCVNGSELTISR